VFNLFGQAYKVGWMRECLPSSGPGDEYDGTYAFFSIAAWYAKTLSPLLFFFFFFFFAIG